MFDPHKSPNEYIEYTVWLEEYHSHQMYNNWNRWATIENYTYENKDKVELT